jgi:predicted phage-related endonuclease
MEWQQHLQAGDRTMSVYEEKESYAASRSHGLGGTDVAAILGLSPWKRPIDIYAGKVNPGSLPELDKECLRWGNLLEPIVRQEYAARFNVDVVDPPNIRNHFGNYRDWNGNTLVVGKEPWMLGAPEHARLRVCRPRTATKGLPTRKRKAVRP